MNDYKVRCDASNPDNVELMIYGTIGDTAWWDDVVDKNIAEILNRNKAAKQITVRINSLGGYAHSGIAIYNALQQHPGKVVTIVEGLAASAASIVAMAGETRMLPGSMLMIHNPWTFASGDADDMRQAADMLDTVRDACVKIYQLKTGKSEDDLKGMLKADIWMTAQQAKEWGFANVVEEPTKSVSARMEQGGIFMMGGVAHPAAHLPQTVLNLAIPEPAEIEEKPMTLAELHEKHPELAAQLKQEGREEGVTQERARMQAIEEVSMPGHQALVHAAKFTEPCDANALAARILKAEKAKLEAIQGDRLADAAPLNAVTPSEEGAVTEEVQRTKLKAAFRKGTGRKEQQ